MRAISLFSGGGIGESRLHEIGVEVVVANEILKQRSNLFKSLNPNTEFLLGDITQEAIKEEICRVGSGAELIIATPPCQGVSVAGKNRTSSSQILDKRNYLIFDAIEVIRRVKPRFVVFENVSTFLDLSLPLAGQLVPVPTLLEQMLGEEYHVQHRVLNAADFGVPQERKRAIIVLSSRREKEYSWPLEEQKVSLRSAIGHLPSLESGESSGIAYHYAREHDPRHVLWMKHTPTGRSAFSNAKFFPKGKDEQPIKAYNTTYRRMEWDRPAPTITMRNDAISSQANVHPGRSLGDGTFSDARVLTPLELMILSSVDPATLEGKVLGELEIRRALGEAVPPLLMNAIIRGLF